MWKEGNALNKKGLGKERNSSWPTEWGSKATIKNRALRRSKTTTFNQERAWEKGKRPWGMHPKNCDKKSKGYHHHIVLSNHINELSSYFHKSLGSWKWVKGDPIDEQLPWEGSEPTNSGGNEACLATRTKDSYLRKTVGQKKSLVKRDTRTFPENRRFGKRNGKKWAKPRSSPHQSLT